MVVKDAYTKGYFSKPLVVTMKGRGEEDCILVLNELKLSFPQIHIENDLNNACVLVK